MISDVDLHALLERAKDDPALADVDRKVGEAGIQTWVENEEKALLFAVGAFAPGFGTVVELGSYQGGSASYLAAGIARRGRGRLHSIDPHLGAPTWFGLAPYKRTLEAFRHCIGYCGLDGWVQSHVGDSSSLASVWPAEGIDAVFIDGDHSFLGALKDFECWAPKVRPGGLIMFDDVNGSMAELNEMIRMLDGLTSIRHVGTVGGIAVYRRNEIEPWAMLAELAERHTVRGLVRPWDLSHLHAIEAPSSFRGVDDWPNPELGQAYMVCFFARCGSGPYGYTAASAKDDRRFLHALSHDRGDGDVIAIDGLTERLRSLIARSSGGFRVIYCRPEEAATCAPKLQPGGVLIARCHERRGTNESYLNVRQILLDAGLDGSGGSANLYWGIWKPERLSTEEMVSHISGRTGMDHAAERKKRHAKP